LEFELVSCQSEYIDGELITSKFDEQS